MNPYETLGVPPQADAATIARAYRRAAAAAHPDRHGGDTHAMVRVNVARDILTDPQRRAHYDLSGADLPVTPPLQLRARMQLAAAFASVLQAPQRQNIPAAAARALAQTRIQTLTQIREIGTLQEQLRARAQEVEFSADADEPNVFADQLTAMLGQLADQLAHRQQTLEAVEHAQQLLKAYRSSRIDQPLSFTMSGWLTGTVA